MPLPPNPPSPRSFWKGWGRRGRRAGGPCDEQPVQLDTCGLEGQGWEPGPAGEERERQPQVRRHAGPGEMGKSRDGGEGAVGAGRRSFLPMEEERGATTRTFMGRERQGRDTRLRSSSPEGYSDAHATTHSVLTTDPDTPAHTPHPAQGSGRKA